MTFIKIMHFITYYGVDIAVLGIATCLLTQLLKTTLLKKAPNKLYAFLPVIIGCVMYAVYTMIANMSFVYAFENFGLVLENGFAVGAAATVIYVVCEQLFRGKSTSKSVTCEVVAVMISGYVEDEALDTVAKMIDEEFDSSDIESSAQAIFNTLCEFAQGEADEQSYNELAILIAQTLARIKST